MRVLVTRPAEDAERTAEALRTAGHEPILAPVFAIRVLPHQVPSGLDALVATSANALRQANTGGGLTATPLFAVGDATASEARHMGFQSVVSAGGDSRALANVLLRELPRGASIGWLAGRHRQDEAIKALAGSFAITIIETYENAAVDALPTEIVAALREERLDAVLHFSKRSADVFAALVDKSGLNSQVEKLLHVFISSVAAGRAYPRQRIAARPEMAGMIASLSATT